jgi:hypothetical protein
MLILGFGDKNAKFCESDLEVFSLERLEKFTAVDSNSIDSPSLATSCTTPCSVIKESMTFPSIVFVSECVLTVFTTDSKPARQQKTIANIERAVEVLDPPLI